ncbi:MAG: HNH endonuclease [Elusimicrobiota bacterium]
MSKNLTALSDAELAESLKSLTRDERGRLVLVLKHLAEMDRRRYAINAGFPSLFEYCVRELRYAQGEAARRIHAARAAAKFSILYRALERGLLSLTTVSLLAPHLKWDNHRRLIRSAAGRSTREAEALVAALTSVPPPMERIRFVGPADPAPARTPPAVDHHDDLFSSAPAAHAPTLNERPPQNAPPSITVRRVHFFFTADEALLRDIERARELLHRRSTGGGLEFVFAAALRALLQDIDPERRAARADRRSGSAKTSLTRRRAVPRRVKEEVWKRDGGRCAFLSAEGRRCGTRSRLEFDHVTPWALGGVSDDPANLRLLCRAHNDLAARRVFGDAAIDAAAVHRRSS